ncbi:helix-turn-helix domain-containing protein [Vogesella urethralis]|uniref:helix-turn-helix domain-containing protein n=1 Tax=Vogesella urethralis TaxID=2592656 RepID=UPI0011872138|nr:helix-turn-helix transcriptional regulator [Vogesella urethralis]
MSQRTELPPVSAPDFRVALKEARLSRNLSKRALAHLVGIHEVMPARYEDMNNSNATLPSLETWRKLNAVLFPASEMASGGDELPLKPHLTRQDSISQQGTLLADVSIENIIAELKRRGASSVSINW